MIIFGGAGDLSARKLLPDDLHQKGVLTAAMPLDFEPLRAGAENVIAQLDAVGTEIGSKNVDDYLDTSIIEGLKKEGFFTALQEKYGLH